jgi:hypothetical protein
MKGKTPSAEEKSAALQRVLRSRQFGKAARLRDFLQYIGAHALNGQTEEIHEADIGRAVYQRPDDYTPAEDSIVRVEARNLRNKLEAYFKSEGKADPIVITIPKGAYVPKFVFRDAASPAPGRARAARPASYKLAAALALALALSLAANLWLASPQLDRVASARSGPALEAHPLLSLLFRPGQETYIVLADSLYALAQDLSQRSFSLRDYQSPDFPPADAFAGMGTPSKNVAADIFRRQYTSLTDTHVAAKIVRLASTTQATTSIRFARNMHTRDFKGRNLILLGSSRSNPWYELFDPQLNFKFEYDNEARRPYIHNKHPRNKEEKRYVAGTTDDSSDEIYAVISLVRNLTNDGYVLLVAGTSMEGTEAAGELLLNPDIVSNMFRKLGLEPGGKLQPFEVLMKSSRMEGTSRGAEVVTHRIWGGS